MRSFVIKNEYADNRIEGYLFYYEKTKDFFIELPDNANEWEVPMMFASFVRRGEYTINARWSKIWVQQRIVPPDRQNLPEILKDNGLKAYDEYRLLLLADGRCSQDDYCISMISFEELPKSIQERRMHKIDDIIPLADQKLLILFSDGVIKICRIADLLEKDSPLEILLSVHPEVFEKVRLITGGYGVCWDDNKTISDRDLYEAGDTIPLTKEDFLSFVSKRVVNTAEAAEMLNCSRQNIDDLIKRDKLKPIKTTSRGKLFLKGDIEKLSWV